MSRTSLAAAKAEVVGLLASDSAGTARASLAPVTRVLDHEPYPGDGLPPYWITVSTASIGPTEWGIAIRIYADAKVGAKQVQDTLDTLPPLVEALLTGPYGPDAWQFALREDIQAFVATSIVEVGREDW